MSSNLDKYRVDLDNLTKLGEGMSLDLNLQALDKNGKLSEAAREAQKQVTGRFTKDYQRWYTEAHAVIKQLIPERLLEFEEHYRRDSKRQSLNVTTYTIQDWLSGVRSGENYFGDRQFDDFGSIFMRFHVQLEILKSASQRFETSLFDIQQIVQADLFDSELDAAKQLIKSGFLRGAGAISRVVLERHLHQVCANHEVKTRKKHPSISELNDLLKEAKITDVPTWRFIQRLGDLRNLCDHSKEREPTNNEVTELIDGSDKIVKTLF